MKTKLGRLKDKEKAAKKERENLREAMKKNQGLLKLVILYIINLLLLKRKFIIFTFNLERN